MKERFIPKAVIFDLDGTLIDTETYYRIYWPQACAHFGFEMTDEMVLSMRSLGRPFVQERLKAWFGDGLDYEKVKAYRKELMEAHFAKDGIQIKKGAIELLRYLQKNNIIAAIATASDIERTVRYLDMAGIPQAYFTKLVSATQVEKGKPDPGVYLYACRELGLEPGECMVIEDSPNGVLGAFRAGCKVVMVHDQTLPTEEDERCLYAYIEDLEQLIPML